MASMGGGRGVGVPTHGAKSTEQSQLDATRAQVDEVVVIMRSNVEKVMERDQKLNELDLRADRLSAGATQFQKNATVLKRKFWWQNIKMMIILGVVMTIIIVIIGISIGMDSGSKSSE